MRRRQILAAKTATPKTVKAPSREEIEAQYFAKFGKRPHWKMKPETIRERLDAV